MTIGTVSGLRVLVSSALPIIPSPREDARRIVRHGMADILGWLGEPVGLRPGEPTHMIVSGETLLVSATMRDELVAQFHP